MGFTMPDALVIFGALITLSIAILRFIPKKNNPGNPDNKYVRKDLCDERHGFIEKQLEQISNNQTEILRRLSK